MTPRRTRPANQPADTPAAAGVAVIIALGLIAIGLIAGREFLIRRGVVHTGPWLGPALRWLGRMQWHTWLLAVGFGGVLLGVVLLALAARPRNRRHIGTHGAPTLWLRPTDVARAGTAAALRVPGVTHARTIARTRRVEVHIGTEHSAPDITEAVRAEVGAAVAELADPPKVRVLVEPVPAAGPRRTAAEVPAP
jgi:hypothetical protein